MNTGCPLIGVCLPSFLGKSGATLESINRYVCSLMVSRLLMAMYLRSFCDSLNFDLNLDFLREVSFKGMLEFVRGLKHE